MYHNNLLKEALKELGMSFTEENGEYRFAAPLAITIATPQTQFSFATRKLDMDKDDNYLYMTFDHELTFRTAAPFVTFTSHKDYLLIRLSHTKF
ncbi:MAG: hypothetical protein AB1420_01955 [Bacillota bacterium]